jgi:hypothetical protein
LPCDVFRFEDGVLQEGLCRPHIKPAPNTATNVQALLRDAGFDLEYRPCTSPAYSDAALNAVLAHYAESLRDGHLLLPVGTAAGLRALRAISPAGLVLLATDKGFGQDHEALMRLEPDIVLHHEAFSLSVNFHALGLYARQQGGNAYHQHLSGAVSTSVLSLGLNLEPALGGGASTRWALQHWVDTLGAAPLFNVYTQLCRHRDTCSAEELLSLLTLLQWDPMAVGECLDVLRMRLPDMGPGSLRALREGLRRSAGLFYVLPDSPPFLTGLGLLHLAMQGAQDALACFALSTLWSGPQAQTAFLTAQGHFQLGQYAQALAALSDAQAMGYPDTIALKGWLAEVTEALAAGTEARLD